MFSTFYPWYHYIGLGIRLIMACLCGAVIGVERERRYKDAGIRTHVIVCCSAALMMIVSKYGFADLSSAAGSLFGTKDADPSRIAAQVISGVCFIGAGVIFHNENSTKGLTTAAGLWALAGVGIALGAGMYGIGIFATVLIVFAQTMIHKIATRRNKVNLVRFAITAVNSPEIRRYIKSYFDEHSCGIKDEDVSIENELIKYDLTVNMDECPTTDSINDLFEISNDIKSVRFSILK